MAVNMLDQAAAGTGRVWTEETLGDFLDKLNARLPENSSGRVVAKKRRSTWNLVLFTPPSVIAAIRSHYAKYTWERGLLNEALFADKIWRVGHKIKEAKGEWAKVYTVSEEVLSQMFARMVTDWETKFPKETLHSVAISELQQLRPSRSVPDDPEMAEMTVAQQVFLYTCAYVHWLRPEAVQAFGEAGCQVLDKAKDEWQPWFVQDLRFVALKKDQSATYDVLHLSDLHAIHALLKQTAPGVSLEAQVAQTNTLADEWKKYEEKYADDLKAFETAVTSNTERTRTQRLHELSEFGKLTSKGNSMVATHGKFYFKVPEDACLTKGCAEVSDFCDQIRVAEAVGDTTSGDIPTLLFWT